VVLTVLIWLFNISPDPETPASQAVTTASMFIVVGALIAQWHRRVSIRKRLLSFVIVCAACTIFALPVALLQLPVRSDYGLQDLLTGMCMAALVGELVILGTINTPWPIPIVRIWRGEIGLARTYWVWCFLVGSTGMQIFYAIILALYDLTGSSFIIALRAALTLLLTSLIVVSTWRSARNYQGPRRWRVLARASCFLLGIYVVSILGGLLAEVPYAKVLTGDSRMLDEMFQP